MIYLDFDDTILDTGGFKRALSQAFRAAGLAEVEFLADYATAKAEAGGFELEALLAVASRREGFDAAGARAAASALVDGIDAFVYADFFPFAQQFGKDQLVLLSFGRTPMQRLKIDNAKVAPYFREIIVTDRSKEEHFPGILARHPDERIYFVDDKAEQVDRVKAVAPSVTAMKMERPGGLHRDSVSRRADHVVHDFTEVAYHINHNHDTYGKHE